MTPTPRLCRGRHSSKSRPDSAFAFEHAATLFSRDTRFAGVPMLKLA